MMKDTSKSESFKFGKWFAGIVAFVVGSIVVWGATHPGGLLNPEQPTSTPPHAPPIQIQFEAELFAEQVMIVTVKSGEKVTLKVMDLWDAPLGAPTDCVNAFVAFSWIVRDPYPEGGEDLEFRNVVPMAGGRTQTLASGSTGKSHIGFCDELTLFNKGLQDYRIEIRYASGLTSY